MHFVFSGTINDYGHESKNTVGIIPVKEILYSSMVCYKRTLIGRYYGRSQRTRLLFVAT